MNQTIAGKYPVFGVSYISPSFLRFSRAGSTARRCGWLGSRSQPAGETVDPSAVNPQEEPGTIVIGYGPVGRVAHATSTREQAQPDRHRPQLRLRAEPPKGVG